MGELGTHIKEKVMGALKIGDKVFNSRLILGTGKYPNFELMRESFEVSGTEMVTVAIRRVDLNDTSGQSLLDCVVTQYRGMLYR